MKTKKEKPAPLPWFRLDDEISSSDGRVGIVWSDADAALILDAVNERASLSSSLEAARAEVAKTAELHEDLRGELLALDEMLANDDWDAEGEGRGIIAHVRSALARARGGK